MIVRLVRAARGALARAGHAGQDCVIVTVLKAEGSTPREAGTGMLVTPSQAHGTIGGGHLELKSLAFAREWLGGAVVQGGAASMTRRFALGPALGQCCGGVAHIRFDLCERGVVPPGIDCDAPAPLFGLWLFGAGHVGQALVSVLAQVDCDLVWIDGREQQFPAHLPDNARIEFSEAPEDEVANAPPGAFYLVMTHSHALDLAIVERILKRGDAGFAGLIGSISKRTSFERRLRDRGLEDKAIGRLTCPIGLPGIAGKAPGVVAIAAAAQLLAAASTLSGAQTSLLAADA